MKLKTSLTIITAALGVAGQMNASAQTATMTAGGMVLQASPGTPQAVPAPAAPPAAVPPPAVLWSGPANAQQNIDAQTALIDAQRDYALSQAAPVRTDRPMIVRFTETDAKSVAGMAEDMSIMAHVLEKAVRQDLEEKQREAMGIRLMILSPASGQRDIAIEGVGAIFHLGVNFPLVGPTEKPEETPGKEPTNSAWDEARRELYGAPNRGGGRRGGMAAQPPAVFDPERVNGLKNAVLESLANASNIRTLKADESVTVVITSNSGSGSLNLEGRVAVGGGRAPQVVRFMGNANEQTVVIRAKKSDIDSFAKNKMTLDEFRNKATIRTY